MNTFDIQECTEEELDLVGGGALVDLSLFNGDFQLHILNNAAVDLHIGALDVSIL